MRQPDYLGAWRPLVHLFPRGAAVVGPKDPSSVDPRVQGAWVERVDRECCHIFGRQPAVSSRPRLACIVGAHHASTTPRGEERARRSGRRFDLLQGGWLEGRRHGQGRPRLPLIGTLEGASSNFQQAPVRRIHSEAQCWPSCIERHTTASGARL